MEVKLCICMESPVEEVLFPMKPVTQAQTTNEATTAIAIRSRVEIIGDMPLIDFLSFFVLCIFFLFLLFDFFAILMGRAIAKRLLSLVSAS